MFSYHRSNCRLIILCAQTCLTNNWQVRNVRRNRSDLSLQPFLNMSLRLSVCRVHSSDCLWLAATRHYQLVGSRASGSSVGVGRWDPDGFNSQDFGGQMVCGEVTVVGCGAWPPPSCVCVCVRVSAADEQGDLMPCDPDLAWSVMCVHCSGL